VLTFNASFKPGETPRDIVIERENFTFYAPIVTCLLISLVLSLIVWLLYR
jgi:hypothetical protein